MIDAGFSARSIEQRLAAVGLRLKDVNAICVSHEHADHTQGLRVLHQKAGIPIYANRGTIEALAREPEFAEISWRQFATGFPFTIGDLRIEPFSVPHDAYEPVGFVVSNGECRLAVVTDMGMSTSLIRQRLRNCRALVLESNHDEQLLLEAERPWYLKQRIRGRQGHLSNAGAAALLAEIAGPELRLVVLAHLSQDCNTPELAFQTVTRSLQAQGWGHINVVVSHPDRPTELCLL